MKRHFSFAATVAFVWYLSFFLFKFTWKTIGLPVTDGNVLLLAVASLPVSLYVGWSSYYKKE